MQRQIRCAPSISARFPLYDQRDGKSAECENRFADPLIQRISRKADEQVSILVGKEAISYFSIDNNSRKLSENVFLLRSGHPVAEEVQCVITTMTQQGDNVSHNYYNNPDTTVRYHSNCQAPDNWVEMTRKSKFIVTMNREIVVATGSPPTIRAKHCSIWIPSGIWSRMMAIFRSR